MSLPVHLTRLRTHSLFLVYLASLVWLMLSCIYFAGSAKIQMDFVQPLLLFTGLFVALYAVAARLVPSRLVSGSNSEQLPDLVVHRLIGLFFAIFCSIVVMHLTTLGYLPMVKAYQSTNDYEIARIRQEGYYTLAVWQRYASDYAIKGIGPILLVLSAQYRSRLFIPAMAAGLFYATALFVKANSVYLLLPLVLYFLFVGKRRNAVLVTVLMVASVGVNWTSSSPPVRQDVYHVMGSVFDLNKIGRVPDARPANISLPGGTVLVSLRERLVIVPAQVTAQWYSFYKEPERREYGCGYRLLARAMGCEYQHIPAKLYEVFYPDLVKERGLTGSLNSGSYIHDFANFGYLGVMVGAIFFAMLFTALRIFCQGSSALLALSLMPVLSLVEMPISTVLNSGGWLLIIFTSVLLKYGGGWRHPTVVRA